MKKTTSRAWQRMLSGRRLDLLDPSAVDIEIEDIAHGLSHISRWNGQTSGDWGYSVAQHSLLVVKIFSDLDPKIDSKWRLAALLHDAAEYVIGDMISPFKAAIGDSYKEIEKKLEIAIHIRFNLPAYLPDDIKVKIKKADIASARLEAVAIAGFCQGEADKIWKKPPVGKYLITPKQPNIAKKEFLSAYRRLKIPD